MDIMEERESQLRQSRLTVSKKPRLSLAGGGEGTFTTHSSLEIKPKTSYKL